MKKKEIDKNSMFNNPSTRLRFSIWVIIANFILGIIGMILGSDLTALGVFISLCNTPLYAYILGRTFRGSQIPESYFQQPKTGSGGLGTIINYQMSNEQNVQPMIDDYNQPITENPNPKIRIVNKNNEEIG